MSGNLHRSVGRPLIYSNWWDLWQVFLEYRQWAIDNPLKEEKIFHYKGMITRCHVDKLRALTIEGFCVYAGINPDTFYEYCKRDDFAETCTNIKTAMNQMKKEAAAADLLNANFIGKEIGLKEHVDHSSEDGSMSPGGRSLNDFYNDEGEDDE